VVRFPGLLTPMLGIFFGRSRIEGAAIRRADMVLRPAPTPETRFGGRSHPWPHETTWIYETSSSRGAGLRKGSYSVGPLPGGEELAPLELLPDAGSDDPLVGVIDVPEEE
jgi:hypothetical protein